MQTLAGAGLVRHLDYMSSVSGGGYAASAVAFGYARGAADADPDATFPFGAVDPEPAAPRREEPKLLRFLRSHADYLAQTGLPDLATGAVVVARSLLLNIFLWVTIIGVGARPPDERLPGADGVAGRQHRRRPAACSTPSAPATPSSTPCSSPPRASRWRSPR